LDYLEPILHHYDLTARSGTLTTRGEVEYAPTVKTARLSEVSLDLVDLDYGEGARRPADREREGDARRRGGDPAAVRRRPRRPDQDRGQRARLSQRDHRPALPALREQLQHHAERLQQRHRRPRRVAGEGGGPGEVHGQRRHARRRELPPAPRPHRLR